MTCSWNSYIGCFTAPGWEPGLSPHLCAFCLQGGKTGKLIAIRAHLFTWTMISAEEGQMCKRNLLLAFSNHSAACHSSRKLVMHKSFKVRMLRSLFSNVDLWLVATKPVRTTEVAFVDWALIRTTCFPSGRIQKHVWFVIFTAPRDICRCKSKPQRQSKASPQGALMHCWEENCSPVY